MRYTLIILKRLVLCHVLMMKAPILLANKKKKTGFIYRILEQVPSFIFSHRNVRAISCRLKIALKDTEGVFEKAFD